MVYRMIATGQRVLPLVPRFLGRKLKLEANISKAGYIKVMVTSLRARCYVCVHTGFDEVFVALHPTRKKRLIRGDRFCVFFLFIGETHTYMHRKE